MISFVIASEEEQEESNRPMDLTDKEGDEMEEQETGEEEEEVETEAKAEIRILCLFSEKRALEGLR